MGTYLPHHQEKYASSQKPRIHQQEKMPKNTVNQVSAVSAADVKEIVNAELAAIIQDTKFSMREL